MDCIHRLKEDEMAVEFRNNKVQSQNMLFRKQGQSNIVYRGIKSKRRKYLKDFYITMLDMKWRWAFLLLFAGFFSTTFLFSGIYFVMSYVHGDFEDSSRNDPDFMPCIVGVKSYWDTLLFSMETQSTIGYGALFPHAECGPTIPVVFVQITFGFLLETTLLGFIFTKLARPKHRRHTLIFSKSASICVEDSQLTLQIRVGDIRNTHLIDAQVHGILIKRYITAEQFVYPLFQHEIEFKAHKMKDHLFLFYPMVLNHAITQGSPLYDMAEADLMKDPFELLIILEGTIESTGEMVQAKTSIGSAEIRWGFRFAPVEEYDVVNDKWCINFNKFDQMDAVETPKHSSRTQAENLPGLTQPEPTEECCQRMAPGSQEPAGLSLCCNSDQLVSVK
ncbi:hypothetical protein BsWGS_07457 [Bradybaena similaris]